MGHKIRIHFGNLRKSNCHFGWTPTFEWSHFWTKKVHQIHTGKYGAWQRQTIWGAVTKVQLSNRDVFVFPSKPFALANDKHWEKCARQLAKNCRIAEMTNLCCTCLWFLFFFSPTFFPLSHRGTAGVAPLTNRHESYYWRFLGQSMLRHLPWGRGCVFSKFQLLKIKGKYFWTGM